MNRVNNSGYPTEEANEHNIRIPATPNNFDDEANKDADLLALIIGYLRYWPIYLIVIVACLVLAWLFILSSTPRYPIKASVLFLEQKDGKPTPQISGIDFSELGMGVQNVNVDNELQLLSSREILKKAIEESALYAEVTSRSGLSKKVWYEDLPFVVAMDPVGLSKITHPISFEIEPTHSGTYMIHSDLLAEGQLTIDSLPATFVLGGGLVSLTPKEVTKSVELPGSFSVKITSPLKLAINYAEKGGLTAERANKQSSVAKLGITAINKRHGEYFLTKLIEVYNRERAIDKNAAAQRTYQFINERINLIGQELSDTERELEQVKKNQGVTGYQDLGVVVATSATIEQRKAEAETQLKLVSFLINDLKAKQGSYEIIPGSLGFTDGTLQTAVELYNQMVFERNGLLESANKEHPRVKTLTDNLALARNNILDAADVAKQGLEIQLDGLKNMESRYSSKILEAPTFERISTDIERQRSIRSNLFLMLLTRREETSIQLAASIESARVVDTALATDTPATPKKPIIYLAGLLLGLVLPTAGIFLWRLTRTKIRTVEDLKSLTNLPFAGSIPSHTEAGDRNSLLPELVVELEGNSTMTEVFRNLRTNISFITQNKQPLVLLCTSTVSGEGKTFVVSNLALSLSALQKRVLLIGLDIRNPQLRRLFDIRNASIGGMTNLLSDASSDPLRFVQKLPNYPYCDIINAGSIPPNPTELLASHRLEELFDIFRKSYDYILIDSAPVGPVVDSLVLSRVADYTLYVIRSGKTNKQDLEYINYLADHRKLPNISIALNDVALSASQRSQYGYGYGYAYNSNRSKK